MGRRCGLIGAAGLAVAIAGSRAAAGECLAPLVTGGESARSDCQLEFHVVNPDNEPFLDTRGRVNPSQTCRDGDATCDADGAADGICSFELALCFNCDDPALPACLPVPTREYGLFRPRLASRREVDVENGTAMLEAVRSLGGAPREGRPSVIDFDPPLSDGICTPLVSFEVPLRRTSRGPRATRTTIRARALAPMPGGVRWDADFLRLVCLPASRP